MTNKKHIFSIIFIGSLLTGCATGPSPTGIGLYTDVKGPITATSLPATKTGMWGGDQFWTEFVHLKSACSP